MKDLADPVNARVPTLLLFAHAALSLAVAIRQGTYNRAALACAVVACIVILCVAFGPASNARRDATPSPQAVALWLMALALGAILGRPFGFAIALWFPPFVFAWNQILLFGGMALLIASFRPLSSRINWGGIVFVIIGVATALRVLLLVASPDPPIDVFTMREDGAAALLQGRNPYETPVRDLMGAERYGYTIENYVYPPATLFPDAVAIQLGGGVRMLSALADLGVCLILIGVARRRLPKLWRSPAALLTAAPLLYSKGPFIMEQSWTEPLLLVALTLWWGLAVSGRERAAAVAFGYFLALKQYLVFWVVAFVGYALGRRRLALIAIPPVVVFATVIPFLVWNLQAFIDYPIRWMFTESFPFRTDSLSLPGLWFRMTGDVPPGTLAIAAGGVTAALLTWRWWRRGPVLGWREDVLLVGIAATLVAFLVGPQAFANYYYLMTNALILAIVGAGLNSPGPGGDGESVSRP
ncbi:MAG: hypothetical protein IH885_04200 [Myxococcales bacterium]|nr:hypothetical protein [Myxococcales bacterium]